MRIQLPCGSSCEDGPCGAPGSGWTEDAVRAGHVVAAASVTLRRLRAPGSMSHRSPPGLILGRRGGPSGPWAVSTGQTRGELVPRGRALGAQGLEPTWATPKLAQLHRPVLTSLSCVDTGQAFRTHSLGLEHGRGRPWASENRTVLTHLGSPAAPAPLPHICSGPISREAPSPREAPAVDTGGWWASLPRSPPPCPMVTAVPALVGREVPQQLVVLTPGELGSGYRGPPAPHHGPGLSTSEGPEPMAPGGLGG